MRGQTLAKVLSMVKGEVGLTLVAGVNTARDQDLYTIIQNWQEWLATEYDWPFLEVRKDVTATVGTQYLALPIASGALTVKFERPVKVEVLYNSFYHSVEYGIDSEQYNYIDSAAGEKIDPIQRWKFKDNGTDFEVWPLPAIQQTVRFTGQRPLSALVDGTGAFDPTKTLDLDDLLVVLYAAAHCLQVLKSPLATTTLQRAQHRLSYIRSVLPVSEDTRLVLGQNMMEEDYRKVRKLVAIA